VESTVEPEPGTLEREAWLESKLRDAQHRVVDFHRLRERMQKLELDNESLHRVIRSRDVLTYIAPGSRCFVGPEHIECEVIAVHIAKAVTYTVGGWVGAVWITQDVPEHHVQPESPLIAHAPRTQHIG
jgi:hypothetical protein